MHSEATPLQKRRATLRSSPRNLLAAAGLCLGCAAPLLAQPIEAYWLGGSGQWSNLGLWSLGSLYPNNGNPPGAEYHVVFGQGTGTVTLNVNATVNSVDLQAGTLYVNGRTLTLLDELTVGNSAQLHLFFGTIAGGTLNIGNSGSGLRLEGANNTLRGVTINGNATFTDNVAWATINDGLTVNGVMRFQSRQGGLAFAGDQTLAGGTFIFDTANNAQDRMLRATNGSIVTFDPNVVIRGRQGLIEGPSGSGELIHQGLISADVAGQYLRIAGRFTNEGTVEAINGGILELTTPSWQDTIWNNGLMRATAGSVLDLAGNISLGPSSTFDTAAGTVNLRGTLKDSTLLLDGQTGSWNFGGGGGAAINNSTVSTTAGTQLNVLPSFLRNEFNNVAFNGDMAITGGLLVNGGSLDGSVVMAPGSTLDFAGDWTSGAQISATNAAIDFGGQFTLGPGFSLNRTGGSVRLSGTLLNTGNTLTLDAATGDWNLGPGVSNAGSIVGGTVRLLDGATLVPGTGGGNWLRGVTLEGQLRLDTEGARLRIADGLSGGTVRITGADAALLAENNQTISGTTISFEGTSGLERRLAVQNGSTLTIGSDSLVRGGRGILGQSISGPGGGTIINQGIIDADVTGQTLAVQWSTLINQGLLRASNGGALTVQTISGNLGQVEVTGAGSSMTLAGTYTANDVVDILDGGRLRLNGNWTNSGVINVTDSALELGGTFNTAAVGTINRSNGDLRVVGSWNNTADQITLSGAGGGLTMAGGTITGGTISASNGAALGAAAGTSSTLTNVTLNSDVDLSGGTLITNGLILNGTANLTDGALLRLNGSWSNNGVINVAGSTLQLGGTVPLSQVGVINRTADASVQLVGTLNGFGQTMTISPTSMLTGISSPGQLNLTELNFVNNPTFTSSNGVIAAAALTGTGTINAAGSLSLRPDPAVGGDTLTIGQDITLLGRGIIGRTSLNGGTVVNQGTIRANSPGGMWSVWAATFLNEGLLEIDGGELSFYNNGDRSRFAEWSNTGTIRLIDGVLRLGGRFTTAGLGNLERLGGEVIMSGELINTGAVLTLDETTGSWNFNGGRLVGGQVNLAPGYNLLYRGTLVDVTFNGDPTLDQQMIYGGLTINGTATLIGQLRYHDSGPILGEFVLDEGSIATNTSQVLTVPPETIIRGRGSVGVRNSSTQSANQLINDGLISADVSGQTLSILADAFTNNAVIEATDGGTLSLLRLGGGQSTWTNHGTIRATNGGTVELAGNFTLQPGTILDTAGGVLSFRTGTLNNVDSTLTLNALSGDLLLGPGARIEGGTVAATEGSRLLVSMGTSSTVLSGVNLLSDVDVQSGTLAFEGLLTHQGTIRTLGSGVTRVWSSGPNATYAGGTIALLGASAASPHELSIPAVGGTLTIAADSVVRGGNARVTGSTGSTVINHGRISADIQGQTLDVIPRDLVNHGTLEATNGGTLTIARRLPGEPTSLTRTWSGNGVVRVTEGSTVNLDGRFPSSAVQNMQHTGGTVNLLGVMDNTDASVVLDGPGKSWNLLSGEIIGGTVHLLNGARFVAPSPTPTTTRIDGAIINGDVDLSGGTARLHVFNGGQLTGTTTMSGPASGVIFIGNTALDQGTFILDPSGGGTARQLQFLSGSATLGPDVVIRGSRGTISGDITNHGLISIDLAGEPSTIQGSMVNHGTIEVLNGSSLRILGNWMSPGTLRAVDSTLELGGIFGSAVIPSLDLSGATVRLSGAINNTGSTMTLDGDVADWILYSGTSLGAIKGGTVNLVNGARLQVQHTGSYPPVLEAVTFNGDIELNNPNNKLTLRESLSLNGDVRLTAPGTGLVFERDVTIHSGTIHFDGASGGTRTIAGPTNLRSTLTLGPSVVIHGGNGALLTTTQRSTIINQGLIAANVSGQSIHIDTYRFVNTGVLEASNGGFFTFFPGPPGVGDPDGDSGMVNSGQLRIGAASTLVVDGAFEQTSEGLLHLGLAGLTPGQSHAQVTFLGRTILGGTLSVSLAPGFVPQEGDVFQILTGEFHQVSGAFSTLALPPLLGDVAWWSAELYTLGVVRVVPSPGSALLLGFAVLCAGGRRRSRA